MIIDWFINKSVERDLVELTKHKILVAVLLLSLFTCLILSITKWLSLLVTPFPPAMIVLILIALLAYYKVTNSAAIVGNGFVACLGLTMFYISTKTGGIFSEDFHGIFILPIIAFVLVGIRSAILTLIICTAWSFVLYNITNNAAGIDFYRSQTLNFEPKYYLVISFINLFFVTALIILFEFFSRRLLKNLTEEKDKLELQTYALERTEKKLIKSNKELESYAYMASHDLKEPIHNINSLSNLMQMHLKEKNILDAEIQTYVGQTIAETKQMNSLINGLLEYAKLSNEIDKSNALEIISTNKIVKKITEKLNGNANVVYKDLPNISGEKIQIQQLFQNLFSNALKFTENKQSIEIEIGAIEKDKYWQFSFADNGIGIEERYFERIFELFKRVKSEKVYSGTGIGLAICKKIVESHKGKIWVESVPNQGTTVYFTLSK